VDYEKLVYEISRLNLNREYSNTNHDTKLVNFFYDLHRSNELDLDEVGKAIDALTNEYGEKMRENIQDIAYFISLLNLKNS